VQRYSRRTRGLLCLQTIGDGSIAQFVLCRGSLESFASVNFGYFVAVTLAIYVSGSVSGEHVASGLECMIRSINCNNKVMGGFLQWLHELAVTRRKCAVFYCEER